MTKTITQNRTIFNQAELQSLADTIKANGLIQPISVRQLPDTELYQIVAGERRFRACKLAGMETISAIVLDLSDEEVSILMMVENTSRKDLDPIDEARAYQSRIDHFGWSVRDCAKYAGVSSVHVNFRLKLLKLRPDLQALCRSGDLQLGYAQTLADGNLDCNFQMIAIKELRDNPKPTPTWFRKVVSRLLEKQAQGQLFDLPLMGGPILEQPQPQKLVEPPHPKTTIPPQASLPARPLPSKPHSGKKPPGPGTN
jgi:ParB family chromosome partitioning protein